MPSISACTHFAGRSRRQSQCLILSIVSSFFDCSRRDNAKRQTHRDAEVLLNIPYLNARLAGEEWDEKQNVGMFKQMFLNLLCVTAFFFFFSSGACYLDFTDTQVCVFALR